VTLATTTGTLAPSALVTDEDGGAAARLTAPAGTVTVTATIPNGPTSSTLVAVQRAVVIPEPTPTPPSPTPTPGTLSVALHASTAQLGTSTMFSAVVSGGGSVWSMAWTFGDGASFTGISSGTAHLYAAVGTYTASVTVTDSDGNRASAPTTVTVTPPPPAPPSYAVSLSANPNTFPINQGPQFTLTATVTPRNGAPPPTQYEWDCAGERFEATTTVNTYACSFAGVSADNKWRPRVVVRSGSVVGSATTTVTIVP
jgi:hypothetical protein